MLGPNNVTRDLASQTYAERLSHSARIQLVQRDRREDGSFIDRFAARRVTVTRLAATAVAAGAALALTATTMASSPSVGGGAVHLIR